MAAFNHVFVVEINDEGLYGYGQLAGLLRARYCDPKIKGLNKTDGLTWKVRVWSEAGKTIITSTDQSVRSPFDAVCPSREIPPSRLA